MSLQGSDRCNEARLRHRSIHLSSFFYLHSSSYRSDAEGELSFTTEGACTDLNPQGDAEGKPTLTTGGTLDRPKQRWRSRETEEAMPTT